MDKIQVFDWNGDPLDRYGYENSEIVEEDLRELIDHFHQLGLMTMILPSKSPDFRYILWVDESFKQR